MRKHEDIFGQVNRLAVAVALCIAAMLAVYALAGRFTNAVLLGALIGFVLGYGQLYLAVLTVPTPLTVRSKGIQPHRKPSWQIQSSGVIRLVVLVIIYILLFRCKVL